MNKNGVAEIHVTLAVVLHIDGFYYYDIYRIDNSSIHDMYGWNVVEK